MELADYGLKPGDLTELKRLFEHATTFGSLIQVPEELAKKLPALKQLSEVTSQDLFVSEALKRLGPLLWQAELLVEQYDVVVVNPPYMGSGGMNKIVKAFSKDYFPRAKSDLFACFVERVMKLSRNSGHIGVVAPFVWMFLSSYKDFREFLISQTSLASLVQLEYNAFEPAMVPVAAFTILRCHLSDFTGSYVKLSEFKGHQNQAPRTLQAIADPTCGWFHTAKPDEFKKIPGSPVAYWVGDHIRRIFAEEPRLDNHAETAVGLFTCDNRRFLRNWQEVSAQKIGFAFKDRASANASGFRFFPIQKGGGFRKWYGLNYLLVQFDVDGLDIRNHRVDSGQSYSLPGEAYYFRSGITWSGLTSSLNSFRQVDQGHVFESNKGQMLFSESEEMILGFLNSCVARVFVRLVNPTLSIQSSEIRKLPLVRPRSEAEVRNQVCQLVDIARADDAGFENSWGFRCLPLLTASSDPTPTLESSYTAWITQNRDSIAEMKCLEEENNRLFIDAYGLADELTPDVPLSQITLTVNPAYRYGGKLTEEEQWTRFRQDTMEELVSYAIGCMMGRYSLDAPGLIYANSGNEGFESSRYPTFPADDDGIVPLTDTEWFDDDAAQRLVEFISVAWDKSHLHANLDFLADNLSPKKGESSRDTIRRYLCDKFYKDHMQTYKKRPIYWLFSSGKQKAFQCLVYLHRYNEGTLARMRTEYVIPLTSKLSSHVEKLEQDKDASDATAEIKRLQKQIDTLHKQQAELSAFDEKLRHYADHRISLDLDDGVKMNYGKFGDLLAEVKAITGIKA